MDILVVTKLILVFLLMFQQPLLQRRSNVNLSSVMLARRVKHLRRQRYIVALHLIGAGQKASYLGSTDDAVGGHS